MRITQISAKNLQGQEFSTDLAPITMLVGPNASGKTARMRAIRLGLLGHDPDVGATNPATWQLASGNPMTVGLKLDNGTEVVLTWEGKAGQVKCRQVGDALEIPTILLNAREYFGMSEQKRTDYIFSVTHIDADFTPDAILAGIRGLLIPNANQHHEAALGCFCTDAQQVRYKTIQEWLATVTLSAKADLRSAKDLQAAMRSSIAATAALEQQQHRDAPAIKRDIEAAQAETNDISGKISGVQKELEQDRQRQTELKTHEASVKAAESALLQHPVDPSGAILKLQSEIAVASDAVMNHTERAKPIRAEIVALSAASVRTTQAAIELTRRLRIARELHDAPHPMTECPECHFRFEEGRDAREETFRALEADLTAQIETEQHALAEAGKQIANQEALLPEADAADFAIAKQRGLIPDARKRLATLVEQQNAIKAATQSIQQSRAIVASITILPGHEVAARLGQLEALRQSLTGAQLRFSALQDEVQAAVAMERDAVRIAEQAVEQAKGLARQEALKIVVDHLQDQQAKLVQCAFGAILARANVLAAPILKTNLEFRDGEVGRTQNGAWISNKTFSGTEQAVTFLAIQCALSQDSPIKICLFDEMTRLDDDHKVKFLDAVKSAIRVKLLDQFVGIDTSLVPYAGQDDVLVVSTI